MLPFNGNIAGSHYPPLMPSDNPIHSALSHHKIALVIQPIANGHQRNTSDKLYQNPLEMLKRGVTKAYS